MRTNPANQPPTQSPPVWLRAVMAADRTGSAWYVGTGFFFAPVLLLASPWPALTTVLFLGGWLPPFHIAPLTWIPGPIWFILKICFMLFVFIWARATLPRYRYDQLMRLGWKVFLPLSLLWVVITSGVLVAFDLLPR